MVAESRFTPAPLVVQRDTTYNYAPFEVVTTGDYPTATAYMMGDTMEQAEANARLYAAAPDLLAALEAFLRAPSVDSSGPGSVTIAVQSFNLASARAAITKAIKGA